MNESIKNCLGDVTEMLEADYRLGRAVDGPAVPHPDREQVADMTDGLLHILLPGYYAWERGTAAALESCVRQLNAAHRPEAAFALFQQLPALRELIQLDAQAAWEGDPAAADMEEVLSCYPGLFAVAVYRLAHLLHTLEVPRLPRMMAEYAHSRTGIDIHPGAAIGSRFFIDHGTGTVIGETAVIGRGVKLYQGVTLGGLSTRGGQELRGIRRHPTLEDRVTVYANATVLGGETVIGHDSIIGANAFITDSVPPCTTVTNKAQELCLRPNRCPGCPLAR